MSEQVPADGQPRRRADLLERFLDTVLAEIALAGVERLAYGVDRECLGDGDQGNRGGIPAD